MSDQKTVKQLTNEIGWKRDVVMTAHKQLLQAEAGLREAQWKLDEAIDALAELANAPAVTTSPKPQD